MISMDARSLLSSESEFASAQGEVKWPPVGQTNGAGSRPPTFCHAASICASRTLKYDSCRRVVQRSNVLSSQHRVEVLLSIALVISIALSAYFVSENDTLRSQLNAVDTENQIQNQSLGPLSETERHSNRSHWTLVVLQTERT